MHNDCNHYARLYNVIVNAYNLIAYDDYHTYNCL